MRVTKKHTCQLLEESWLVLEPIRTFLERAWTTLACLMWWTTSKLVEEAEEETKHESEGLSET